MTAARVAIVIPCFNAGATLAETAASAVGEALELLVVDDGSTDPATLELLDRLEEEGIRVVRRPNGGVSAARMTGLEATSTPYYLTLDADDVLVPGAAELLEGALDKDPEAAVAWGDLETFGLTSFRVPSVPVLDPWFATYLMQIPPATLYRKEALLETGGWHWADARNDRDLWLTFAERGYRGAYVPEVVVRYRRAHGSMHMEALSRFDELATQLEEAHSTLFASRRENRRRSPAPRALKILVPAIDRLPISAVPKFHAFQVLLFLFWNGGPRVAASLAVRALAARLGPAWRR
jgi:glycosyltransferase involved in cell wall biosynthesis